MLEIAEAFTKLPTPPKRSILFLAVTAEEKGLLGAKYYASTRSTRSRKTLANINIDGVNQWGRTRDLDHRRARATPPSTTSRAKWPRRRGAA